MKIGGYSPAYTKPQSVTASKNEATKPSNEENLAALKKEISSIFGAKSYKQSSKYLNISDDAYDKMLEDPAFKDEIINMLETEKKYTGSAIITTTITAEGWSSHNYASVPKDKLAMVANLLPEYMNFDPDTEDKVDNDDKDDDKVSDPDKNASVNDRVESYFAKNQYQRTIQQMIQENLLKK